MSVHLERARLLIAQNRLDDALGQLELALAEDPEDFAIHGLLAVCLAAKKRFPEAVAAANQSIALAPDEAFSHFYRAYVMGEMRRFADAEESIEEAIRLDPWQPAFHGRLASIHGQCRRWPQTLAAAEAGLALDAEHEDCLTLRALALSQMGRRAEIAAAVDDTLARHPDNAVAHAVRGWSLLQQRESDEAIRSFQEALRLDPDSEFARKGLVEALRARYWLYSWVLQALLWIGKLSPQARWALVLGPVLLRPYLTSLAEFYPPLSPVVWGVIYAYSVFVFLSWSSEPIFTLLLRLNRYGRAVLRPDEVDASNAVGACLLLALGWGVASIWIGNQCWRAALAWAVLTITLSSVYQFSSGWRRLTMGLYALALGAFLLGGSTLMIWGLVKAGGVLVEKQPGYLAYQLGLALSMLTMLGVGLGTLLALALHATQKH